jgi:hypothetical protein
MTYHQFIKWREDSHGLVIARVVISDSYDSLFADLIDSTECNILIIDDIVKSLKDDSGGIEKRELRFSINEALVEKSEKDIVTFIKTVENLDVNIFISVFIDTGDIPVGTDILFSGTIQHIYEGEDLQWSGAKYESEISAVRLLKFTAKTYDESVINSFSMNDLIKGNEALFVTGIDSTWETANVKDRQGYFYNAEPTVKRVCVDSIVNLNDLLRKLADNLEQSISDSGLGTIQVEYDDSIIPPNFHPARWKLRYPIMEGVPISRYVAYDPREEFLTRSYRCYTPDKFQLHINPDGKPGTITEDSIGLPNDEDTINYYTQSPWITYRRVKALDNELNPALAKEHRFDKISNFYTFIIRLAAELGMMARIYWSNGNTLRIGFISVNTDAGEAIELSTAVKGNIKITSNDMDKKDYQSVAFYKAEEGYEIYQRDDTEQNNLEGILKSNPSGNVNSAILLTISPTIAYFYASHFELLPGETEDHHVKIPHNHVFYNGSEKIISRATHAIGLHSAIYMCVPNFESHEFSSLSPDYYWTPAGKITFTLNGDEQQFDEMIQYLDYLQSFNKKYQLTEYNLDIPHFFCGRKDGIISWKNIELLNTLELDGAEWKIVEVKHSLKNIQTSIVLQNISKFSFNNSFVGDIAELSEMIQIPTSFFPLLTTSPLYPLGEGILPFDLISLKDDGTYERTLPTTDHYHRIEGIAIINEDGLLTDVRKSGVIFSNDFADLTINTLVFLQLTETGNNWNATPIEVATDIGELHIDLFVIVGKYVGYKTIELNANFQPRIQL